MSTISQLRTEVLSVPIIAGSPRSIGTAPVEIVDLNMMLGGPGCMVVRVAGDGVSMIGAGISPDDYLIVQRTSDPPTGSIVVARLNDEEYTIKRWERRNRGLYLVPANGDFNERRITPQDDCEIIGIVKFVVHRP